MISRLSGTRASWRTLRQAGKKIANKRLLRRHIVKASWRITHLGISISGGKLRAGAARYLPLRSHHAAPQLTTGSTPRKRAGAT